MKKLFIVLLFSTAIILLVSCNVKEARHYDENDKSTWWMEDYSKRVCFLKE